MNAPIQGLAADIFKVALVRLDEQLDERGLDSEVILQVHDEVILEVRPTVSYAATEDDRAARHVGRVRPAGAARGQPVPTATAGPRPRAIDPTPLVRGRRRPPRAGVPALLLHEGHRAGGRLPDRDARARAGDDGARRRLRSGPPRRRAGQAGHPGRSASTSASGSSRSAGRGGRPGGRQRPRVVRAVRRPGDGHRRRRSMPPSRCAREPSAWVVRPTAATRRTSWPTRRCWAASAGRLRPGGRVAVSAFSSYFQVKWLEDTDTFDAAGAVNHEHTELRDGDGHAAPAELWTTCYTPRELRLLATSVGFDVDHIWSVTPGGYDAVEPTIESHEFLLRRPPRRLSSEPPNGRRCPRPALSSPGDAGTVPLIGSQSPCPSLQMTSTYVSDTTHCREPSRKILRSHPWAKCRLHSPPDHLRRPRRSVPR